MSIPIPQVETVTKYRYNLAEPIFTEGGGQKYEIVSVVVTFGMAHDDGEPYVDMDVMGFWLTDKGNRDGRRSNRPERCYVSHTGVLAPFQADATRREQERSNAVAEVERLRMVIANAYYARGDDVVDVLEAEITS